MEALKPFQLNIFNEINKSNVGKNIMVSPLSIYHILSLTANGALNNTLNEMLKALNEKDLKSMNSVNIKLNSDIQKLTTVELANAVFTKFKPEAEFIKMINQYKAEINTLESVAQVNKWCKEKTHNKIPKILDSLTPNDLMVLINAIYFKGKWVKSFNKRNTRKNLFLNFNKTPIELFFMNTTNDYMYFEDEEVQALSMNYKNDNLEALILLPKHQIDINNYISNLTSQKYQIIISKLSKNKVILSMPKFVINFEAELTHYFNSLGMVEAFTDQADFSTMSKSNKLKISKIVHKTFIEVDEEGTEAAAVTAVVMRTLSVKPKTEIGIEMNVVHPFLFIIRSNQLPLEHDIMFISKVESLENKKNNFDNKNYRIGQKIVLKK